MSRLRFLDAQPGRKLVRLRLLLVLAASLLISLSGCGMLTDSDPSICPPYPVAGNAVADEIEDRMFPAENYPAFWGWLNRLDVLREQLE